jgi:hypothetical protein
MTKTCPACGFVSNAEARFCRMCGALLARANEPDGAHVSPHASTVPLSGVHSQTNALSPHDTGSPTRPPTADLQRHELDELLRRSSDPSARGANDDGSTSALAADSINDATDGDSTDEDLTGDASRPLRIRVRPIETDAPDSTDAPALNVAHVSTDATRSVEELTHESAETETAQSIETATAESVSAATAPQTADITSSSASPSHVATPAHTDAATRTESGAQAARANGSGALALR